MKSEEDAKIFVGGLSWATTAEKMKQYFSKYGEVVESSVLQDKATQQSRGFGFVKFQDPASVVAVLKSRPHVLDDKQVDPKPCTPREVQMQKKEAEIEHITKYKIFIGGLTQNMSVDEVKRYFEEFGPTSEVVFALYKGTEANKGFGFVTFETEAAATNAVKKHYHDIGGKKVEAKRAQPREKMRSTAQTTTKKNAGDNMMQDQMYYQNAGWGGQMPWVPPANFGMGGGMGPSGGYMPPDTGYTPDTGYDPYGVYSNSFGSNYNYAAYNPGYKGPPATGYPDMSKYSTTQPSGYSSSKSNRSSGTDSRSYHPYKR